jgi:glutathione S-transferase-like protein
MARPLKLYNHAVAPNPRRVRIFAAEKGIEFSLKRSTFWPAKAARPNFLQKTRPVGCRSWNLMTVHISPSRSRSAAIWRDFIPSRTFWGAISANRRRSRGGPVASRW